MSAPHEPADAQAQALVDEILARSQAEIAALRAGAAREAQAIRQLARDKARRQQRRALAELRALERQRMQQLHAEIETAARRRQAAQSAAVLAEMEPALQQALARRWDDPAARAQWVQALVALARRRLRGSSWQVTHPADGSPEDLAAWRKALQAAGPTEVTLQADASLRQGLVIECDGARLDGSADALQSDRPAVQALLLAQALAKGAP